ncbi:MAG: hypothetical protein IJ507_01195 [Clostridia bacterium]|nr:hypothetical protein [Clostridia bacterium]
MKKLTALLLACILLLGCVSALADDTFTLRNGVHFGETMDQVKLKETLPLSTQYGDEHNLYTDRGSVATFPKVEVWYRFKEDTGKLYEMRWSMNQGVTDKSTNEADFEKLHKALTSKYGDELGYDDGSCYIITGGALNGAVTITNLYSTMFESGVGKVIDYAEWDVPFGNGEHVKIELVRHYYGSKPSEAKYYINVGYTYFTDADLDAAVNEKNDDENAIMNDI